MFINFVQTNVFRQNIMNGMTDEDFDRAGLIATARKAGKAVGTKRADAAYADLILMDGLDDEERERLGYATHAIAQAKQQGISPSALWCYVTDQLRQRNDDWADMLSSDKLTVGVLAFTAGLCGNERQMLTGEMAV